MSIQAFTMCSEYLDVANDIPAHELQIDVRGLTEMVQGKNELKIAIGEIKLSGKLFEKAKQQLKERFRVLTMAAECILGNAITSTDCIGKVHFPEKSLPVDVERRKELLEPHTPYPTPVRTVTETILICGDPLDAW